MERKSWAKKLIVFTDSGDTLVNEGTEYRNEGSPIVQSCELIDGAKEMLLTLKERGYTIELVADGCTQSFDNSYGQHGLKNIFDAKNDLRGSRRKKTVTGDVWDGDETAASDGRR